MPSPLVYRVVENKGGGEKGSICVESLANPQKLRKQGRGKGIRGRKKAANSADGLLVDKQNEVSHPKTARFFLSIVEI